MRKTSGLILDLYDDVGGDIVRSIFPQQEDIPGMIKSARALSASERDALPDDVFALVMANEGHVLRKFACHDAGNTALSVLFFLKTAHKLPDEAQQLVADNLKVACEWYGLDIPEELEKVAGIGKVLTALQLPGVVGNTTKNVKANLAGIRQAEAGGNHVANLEQMHGKMAEVSGTSDMPQSDPDPAQKRKFPIKTAGQDFGPEETERYNGATKGWQPKRNPQAKLMKPFIDVTGKEPSKTASPTGNRFALGDRYPISSYNDVKQASEYFTKYASRFAPEERREYCLNLTKRANELGMPLPVEVRKYAGSKYADEEAIKVAKSCRKALVTDEVDRDMLNALFEKRASISPEQFVEALSEFDRVSGVDKHYDIYALDPYVSVLGVEKTAEDEDWSEVCGNILVTTHLLHKISNTAFPLLKKTFGEDMAKEFKKDPVGIFKSLPVDQKKIISRMADDTSSYGFRV